VMSNTLYRCDNSSNLQKLVLSYILSCISINIARVVIIIVSFSSAMELVLIWFVWCLSLTLVTCDTCVHVIGLGWNLVTRSIALTQIMKHYSSFLAKIDVTRGRSVPSPVENHRPVQVLSLLNPYNSSPDLKLLLDLIATKSGSGLAIRCLAMMETDFAESWAPTGLQVEFEAENVVVYWKDALS